MRALPLLLLVACGGGSEAPVDAAKKDASSNTTIAVITCPATPDKTLTSNSSMFVPETVTMNQGQVLKVTIPVGHDMEPDAPTMDPSLNVDEGREACLRFTVAGTFKIRCRIHSFTGTIIVN